MRHDRSVIGKLRGVTLHRFFWVLLFFLLVIGLVGVHVLGSSSSKRRVAESQEEQQNQSQQAGGRQDTSSSTVQQPQIFIYGGDQRYSSGGIVALASTAEPAVQIGGYDISGMAEIEVYEASVDALLDYLTHDKDGKQTKKITDLGRFQYVATVRHGIDAGSYKGSKVLLPLKETGIWYLKVKVGQTEVDSFVIRSNLGVVVKEGNDELVFWGQDFGTKRSVTGGSIKILSLEDSPKELQTILFDAEGVARARTSSDADIALVQRDSDYAIVPINLKYLNASYSYKTFLPKGKLTRYFIFTDRPLYKPGDTVYFKAILRNDDDARYTVPRGDALVRVYKGYYYEGPNTQLVFERRFPISSGGAISGECQLPADLKVGYYTLAVSIPGESGVDGFWSAESSPNTISFSVQFFRKPESSIEITTSRTELIAGGKLLFKIGGQYFSGQPLMGQEVKYVVYSSNFYEYEYALDQQRSSKNLGDDYRYGYWWGKKITEGVVALDKYGEAEVEVNTRLDFSGGKTQVFSIEATIADGSQNPPFARRNVLIYSGDYGIYRKGVSYTARVNTPLSLPVVLAPNRANADVYGVNLTAKIHRENWVPYYEEGKKYFSYKKEEEDLPHVRSKTDVNGEATLTFIPPDVGFYTITVEGKDAKGNTISKAFHSYVSKEDYPHYTTDGSNELTIVADKQKYEPKDTVKLDIFSSIPNRDVFLSLERGRMDRFQIVHLNGRNTSVEVPLSDTDVPNVYAKVSSFSDYALDSSAVNIPVASDGKKLLIDITPNSKTFGPGEAVTVNLSTTDIAGNPVSADVALWAVDKAIFELSENNLDDIFSTFWKERVNTTEEAHSLQGVLVTHAEGGGCFARGTSVLMAGGKYKNIEDVKAGDRVLTRTEGDRELVEAKVVKTHAVEENGYLIINGHLKVTVNHIMRVNDVWKEAGSVQVGDILTDSRGGIVYVDSVEWQAGKFQVYNLEVENYNTYFVEDIWVHNSKGTTRSVFKDTAYWNPTIRTDSSGKARVSFKLPDNLTVWTLAAVGVTWDTKVGQTTDEIVVTKDIIVRPILPNVLRVGDEIVLSALVQNFTQMNQDFNVGLDFDSGEIEDSSHKNISLKPSEIGQVYWKVRPTVENNAKLVFSLKSKDNQDLVDAVTQEIPVRPFGFEERRAETGEGEKTFNVRLSPDSDKEKSSVTLSISPTIIGTLPTAMKYLISYPYGCVEQTASRLAPAVIAKANPDLFAEALRDKDVDDLIKQSLARLSLLQQEDGGWSWWSSGNSNLFITSYVLEYILEAKKMGVRVEDDLLNKVREYLEKDTYYDPKSQRTASPSREDSIARNYGLTLLGVKDKAEKITDLDNLKPDLLALAVMANYLNGDKDPRSNGLDKLVSMAQTQGNAVFWEEGDKVNFGSKDASTALAVQAIVLANGDRDLAVKGARYLMRTRQTDYWSNTYATAQVIRALVDLSKTGSELTPHYKYTVMLDGKQIASGMVSSPSQSVKDIIIPVANISSGGSSISIEKDGEGQIYSTLLINEFRTDRNARARSNGLTVEREYINEKGEQYSLAVGDTVAVKITVGGLKSNENYAVISDELPAGLVPINQSFINEQYRYNPDSYYTSYDVTDREITENGIILSLYQIHEGRRTYTYRARVVSEGLFIAPPAMASLMYAPETHGISSVQTVRVTKESKVIIARAFKQIVEKCVKSKITAVVIVFLLLIRVGNLIMKRRGSSFFQLWRKIKRVLLRKEDKSGPPKLSQDNNATTSSGEGETVK